MVKRNLLKLFPVAVIVCLAVWVYWNYFYERPTIGIDDANISFVYMRHLANGVGFVYNAGGEHVEGFTSLLWTLTGSILFKLSSHPHLCLFFLSLLIIIITLWQLIVFIDKFFNDRRIFSPYSFFLLCILFLIPGYFEWTVLTLMETGLWSCLLISIILNLCYSESDVSHLKQLNRWFSFLLIAFVVCRPESYLWGFVFLIIRFSQIYRVEKSFKKSVRGILWPAACFVGTMASLTIWRLYYFGFPFPNTYYDKVSADHIYNLNKGFEYIFTKFFGNYVFPIIAAACIVLYGIKVLVLKSFTAHTRIFFILVISLLTAFAVPLYTGGDHFRLARFFQPVMPVFYFAFMIAVTGLFNFQLTRTWNYIAVTLLLIVAMFMPRSNYSFVNYLHGYIPAIKIEFELAEKGKNVAEGLNGFFKDCNPLPTQGVLCAGSLAYYYDGNTIDLMGLNNVAMAHANPIKSGFKNHAAFDKETFYRLAPDIAFTTGFISDTTDFVLEENTKDYSSDDFSLYTIYKNIFKDDRFRRVYFPVFIFKKNEKECLHTYTNKEFLNRLDTSVYSYFIIKR